MARIFRGVGDHVAKDLLQQARIAMHCQTAGHDAQFQAFVQGVKFELAMQLAKKIVDGEVAQLRLHHARFELVDIENLSSKPDIATMVLSSRLISFDAAGSETSSASMPCIKLIV